MENETITIEKIYTKKEAFKRFIELYPNLSATENSLPFGEYNRIIDFLGIGDLL